MAHKSRLDCPGALAHVIARGNRRGVIFHDAADYRAYLDRLERYRTRDGVILSAYVLMANHVHLLVETGTVPLARTMQTLQFTYSQYYNRRDGTTGHVFQRTASRPTISSRPARTSLGKLLPAVAQIYGLTPAALVAPGRQRAVVPARAMLVYAAQEWGRLITQELGNRLHRDPSMISRLYATYRARPDATRARLRSNGRSLINSILMPDPHFWSRFHVVRIPRPAGS